MKMDVEILDFFPNRKDDERKSFTGTVKAYIPSLGVHILGISVFKRDNFWFFRIPSKSAYDPIQKKKIHYPTFSFSETEVQKKFIDELRLVGRKYIENRMQDIENPLKWQTGEKKESGYKWSERRNYNYKPCAKNVPPIIQRLEKMAKADYVDAPKHDGFQRKRRCF